MAKSVFGFPNWTNQNLVVYHGTIEYQLASLVAGVALNQGRPRADFGQGFYTTTVEGQARHWALLRALRSRQVPAPSPGVIAFSLRRDDLADLQALWFVRGARRALDYWSLIAYCRSGGAAHARATNNGWYDVVVGPVAAARWSRRRAIPNSDQISFHTAAGTNLLDASPKQSWVLQSAQWRRQP